MHQLFQSPIHRGSKCNQLISTNQEEHSSAFSPLFVGEVNVTDGFDHNRRERGTFSPLFVGEVNVTVHQVRPVLRARQGKLLSVPYSSGK